MVKAERKAPADGALKLLAASSKTSTYPTDAKFAKDIDKVLKKVEGIRSTGKTTLGGRRGKVADRADRRPHRRIRRTAREVSQQARSA